MFGAVSWKFFVLMSLPYLKMAAEWFRSQDQNDTGRDDMIGIGLAFAAEFIQAAVSEKELPAVPDALRFAAVPDEPIDDVPIGPPDEPIDDVSDEPIDDVSDGGSGSYWKRRR